jgi:hypothetical protein
MTDDDDGVAAVGNRLANCVRVRARREPLVRLGLDTGSTCDLLGRLACAQQRAREDRLRLRRR